MNEQEKAAQEEFRSRQMLKLMGNYELSLLWHGYKGDAPSESRDLAIEWIRWEFQRRKDRPMHIADLPAI